MALGVPRRPQWAKGKNFVVHYSGDSDFTAEASSSIHLGLESFWV